MTGTRTEALRGIETRTGRGGITRYRGTACVDGRASKGPWTTDVGTAIRWREEILEEARCGQLEAERRQPREVALPCPCGRWMLQGRWVEV